MPEESLPFLTRLAAGWPFVGTLVAVLAVSLGLRFFLVRTMGDSFFRLTGALERWVLTLILLTMIGLSGSQIVMRNFFDSGFVWIDPLLRTLVLWLAFIGAFAATAKGRHIAIDVLSKILPNMGREIAGRFTSLVTAGTCVALANGAWEYLLLEYEFGGHGFLGLPTWKVQSILCLGFALLAYRFLVALVFGVPKETEAAPVVGDSPKVEQA